MAYIKVKLSDDVTMQIIDYTDELMSARLWFTGKGFGGTHHHENQEVNVVISGEFMSVSGDKQVPVHVGQVVQVPPDTEHNMECLTPTGEMVSVWTPVRQDFLKYARTEEA